MSKREGKDVETEYIACHHIASFQESPERFTQIPFVKERESHEFVTSVSYTYSVALFLRRRAAGS